MSDIRKYQHPFFQQFEKPTVQEIVPVAVSTKEERENKVALNEKPPVLIELPKHLFIPYNAQSMDLRRAPLVAAGTSETILNFTAPSGAITRFIAYAVYSDGNNAADYEFIPKVNGRRVLGYHGDPDDNFKINLGLAPDLSNNSLINCQLSLNPGDKLGWTLVNNSAFDTPMGVRMVGYLDFATRRANERVGG